MNRRTGLLFLFLAVLSVLAAAMAPASYAALGERLIALDNEIAADTMYTPLPKLAASANRALADASYGDAYGPPAGDGSDVTDWYNRNFSNGTSAYPPSSPVIAPAPVSDAPVYSPYTAQSPDLYGSQNYGLSTNNVTNDYRAAYGGDIASAPAPTATMAGPSATYDTYTVYTATPSNDIDYSYAPTSVTYDSWYTTAFPGIGAAAVPIIPPVFQPYTEQTLAVPLPGTGYSSFAPAISPITPALSYPVTAYASFHPSIGAITPASSDTAPSDTVLGPLASASQPTCILSLAPARIAPGGATVVTWTSFNTSSAALQRTPVSPSGSRILGGYLYSTSITMNVFGPGGEGGCSAYLTVQ